MRPHSRKTLRSRSTAPPAKTFGRATCLMRPSAAHGGAHRGAGRSERSGLGVGLFWRPAGADAARTCSNAAAMFVAFFHELKSAGLPVTLREYLTLMEAMEADLASRRVEDFYYLSRATLVKDERNLDKFDRVFGKVFQGLELVAEAATADIPAEWLKKLTEKYLTDEEKKEIEAMGGLDKLMETLRRRLAEQKGRHQGGSKWIGTAGTSPFGAYGYNPEGGRIGEDETRNRRGGGGLGGRGVQGTREA